MHRDLLIQPLSAGRSVLLSCSGYEQLFLYNGGGARWGFVTSAIGVRGRASTAGSHGCSWCGGGSVACYGGLGRGCGLVGGHDVSYVDKCAGIYAIRVGR